MTDWIEYVIAILINGVLLTCISYFYEKKIKRESKGETYAILTEWLIAYSHFYAGHRKMKMTRTNNIVNVQLSNDGITEPKGDFSKTLQIIDGKIVEVENE